MRIGVIGCGRIAQTFHLPFLSEMENVEIIALCDVAEKLVSKLAEKYHVPKVYTDYNDLITKAEVDAILNLTPDPFHKVVSIDAMRSGLHVFVEKPIALTVSDSEEMINVAKKEEVTLMVGYMKRYDPILKFALQEFQEVEDCHFIRVHNFFGLMAAIRNELYKLEIGDVPKEYKEKASSMMDDQIRRQIGDVGSQLKAAYYYMLGICCHDINMLRFIFGEPNRVLKTEIWGNNISEGGFTSPSVLSVLEFGNNIRCVFEFSICRQRFWDEAIIAFSPSKRVELRWPNSYLKNFPTEVRVIEGDDNITSTALTSSYESSYKRELLHFTECVEKKAEPVTSGSDAKRDIEVISSIVKSFIENQPVPL